MCCVVLNCVVLSCNALLVCILFIVLLRHAGEEGQEGAGASPAFQLGEQGSKGALFRCNDLFSNC